MRLENLNQENFPGTPAPGAPTPKKNATGCPPRASHPAHRPLQVPSTCEQVGNVWFHTLRQCGLCRYAPEGAHLGAPRSILFGSVACAVTPQRAPTWEPPGPYSSIPDLTPPCSASGTGRGVEEFLRPRLRTGAVAPSCLPFRAEGAVAPMTGSTWEKNI